jgi:hypothetical protein
LCQCPLSEPPKALHRAFLSQKQGLTWLLDLNVAYWDGAQEDGIDDKQYIVYR